MNAVEVRGVRKEFTIPTSRHATVRENVFGILRPRRREQLLVLDGVDLEIGRGEFFGIMGRNGSGKSTLLKILAGIYPADSGTVSVAGSLTPILELGLGFNGELDAIDNVLLLGSVMGVAVRELRHRLDEILAFAELERFASLQLKHFSSGMMARLAYAVAFSAVREILLLDEIFAVGDAGFRQRCEARCRALHDAGHTVVLVSHDARAVASFCTRAAMLDSGRVAIAGAPQEVTAEYLRRLTA